MSLAAARLLCTSVTPGRSCWPLSDAVVMAGCAAGPRMKLAQRRRISVADCRGMQCSSISSVVAVVAKVSSLEVAALRGTVVAQVYAHLSAMRTRDGAEGAHLQLPLSPGPAVLLCSYLLLQGVHQVLHPSPWPVTFAVALVAMHRPSAVTCSAERG
jgi:hypothetical protein